MIQVILRDNVQNRRFAVSQFDFDDPLTCDKIKEQSKPTRSLHAHSGLFNSLSFRAFMFGILLLMEGSVHILLVIFACSFKQ